MGIYYPTDIFQQSVNKWVGIPVLYGPNHPSPQRLNENFEAELKRVGASVVGTVKSAEVLTVGHPRLYANIDFTDQYSESLIDEGHLGISTGFQCQDDGEKLTGEIFPNHVLVFYEDLNNQPVDYGAGFLNKKNIGDTMAEPAPKNPNEGNKPAQPNGGDGAGEIQTSVNPMLPPLANHDDALSSYLNLRQQYTRDVESQKSIINSLTDEKKNLEARLHAYEVEERDRRINTIVGSLPKGLKVNGTELKDHLNKNPLAAIENVIERYNSFIDQLTAKSRQVQGQEYLNKGTGGSAPQAEPDDRDTQGLCSAMYFDDEVVN